METGLAVRAAALLATLAGAWPCCQRALLAAEGDRKLLSVLQLRRSDELTRGGARTTRGPDICAMQHFLEGWAGDSLSGAVSDTRTNAVGT